MGCKLYGHYRGSLKFRAHLCIFFTSDLAEIGPDRYTTLLAGYQFLRIFAYYQCFTPEPTQVLNIIPKLVICTDNFCLSRVFREERRTGGGLWATRSLFIWRLQRASCSVIFSSGKENSSGLCQSILLSKVDSNFPCIRYKEPKATNTYPGRQNDWHEAW